MFCETKIEVFSIVHVVDGKLGEDIWAIYKGGESFKRSLILAAGPTKEDSCEYLQVVRATQPSALTVVKETLP